MSDILERIDHATTGLCPCGAKPEPGSAYCSPDCEPTHRGPDTDAPWLGGPHAARWRPDLVSAFDESGLEQLDEITGFGLTRRWYRHSDGRRFLRLDDGHRWVGAWAPDDEAGSQELWDRLERELTDQRRLDPEVAGPCPQCVNRCEPGCGCPCWEEVDPGSWSDALRRMGEAFDREVLGREGERAVLAGGVDPRAQGTVFWLPNRPASGLPTPAELAGGQVLARSVRPPATWVDETHQIDTGGIVTHGPPPATGEDIMENMQAAYRQLQANELFPLVRMDVSRSAVDAMRTQARPSWPPASQVDRIMGIPVRIDDSLPPGAWRMEDADGQRLEYHTCAWEVSFETGYYRCSLYWSDGTRCDSVTTDPATVRRTERLVGPRATGGAA